MSRVFTTALLRIVQGIDPNICLIFVQYSFNICLTFVMSGDNEVCFYKGLPTGTKPVTRIFVTRQARASRAHPIFKMKIQIYRALRIQEILEVYKG